MTEPDSISPTSLRDLVAGRLELHWPTFVEQHPHLAGAIERIQLVDSVVDRISDDPLYRQAMEAAGHDERILAAALNLATLIDTWVGRTLGL